MRKLQMALLLGLGVVSSAVSTRSARAGCEVAGGFQEYFVLGREDHIYDMFVAVDVAEGGTNPVVQGAMESVVTLTATTDGQTIYYDHWEDGYDADPFSPGATSEMHVLSRGQALSLKSDGSTPGTGDVVPALPRGTELRYDGGDRVYSLGGPVGLVHSTWPRDFAFIGGGIEIYPRKTTEGAFAYVVPIGVDTYDGTTGHFAPFKYVYVEIQAFEDDTFLRIENGVTSTVLGLERGETYSSRGFIGGVAAAPVVINQGTTIIASKPIQVALVTLSDGQFQSRFFTLLPQLIWGRDYVTPYFGPVTLARPANVYVFNPSSADITVTAYDKLVPAGASFSVPARRAVAYSSPGIMGHLLPAGSPARLVSTSTFWGVVAVDYSDTGSDWGFTLLPTPFLSDNASISWSPGSDDQAAPAGPDTNKSPLFVVPVADDISVCVDLDADGLPDNVDTDGNGTPDAGNADYTADGVVDRGCYQVNLFKTPSGLKIFDPFDFDNAGTQIFATGQMAISYGQDTDVATLSNPAELDLGYNVPPIDKRLVDPVLSLEAASDVSTLFPTGGSVTFTAEIRSYSFGRVDGVTVTALLPPGFSYEAGSTSIALPLGSPITPDPLISVGPSGTTLDWGPVTSLEVTQSLTATFRASLAAPSPVGRYTSRFGTLGDYSGHDFRAADCVDVFKSYASFTKGVDKGSALPGDTLTYTLGYARSVDPASPDVIGRLEVRDVLPSGLTFVPGSATFMLSSGSSGAGTYDAATRTVRYPLFDSVRSTSADLSGTFSFQAVIDTDPLVSTICNSADIFSRSTPPTLPGISSPRVCTRVLRPVLDRTKSAPASVAPGQRFTYTINVANSGAAAAATIRVTDLIPAGVSYIAGSMTLDTGAGAMPLTDIADADAGQLSAGFVIVDIPGLAPGLGAEIQFQVRAPATEGVRISNVAIVDAPSVIRAFTNLVVTITAPSPSVVTLTDMLGTPVGFYPVGAPVYVGVADPDQNLDPLSAESVMVVVTDPATGDSETVLVRETAIDIGTFFSVGALPTAATSGSPVPGDGTLEVAYGSEIVATYVDPTDASDMAEDRASIGLSATPSSLSIVDAGMTPLASASRDDLLFTLVADGDEDRDSLAADAVPATLRSLVSGDSEALSCLETAISSGTFLSAAGVRLVPATATPVPGDGLLEVVGGDTVIGDYVDPDDATDMAMDSLPVVGVNLLRNDSITSVSPVTPGLATIFRLGEPSLDPVGGDGLNGVGEGPDPSLVGSADDDDFYVSLIGASELDPDAGVIMDRSRRLVFYQTDAVGGAIKLVKEAGSLRLYF